MLLEKNKATIARIKVQQRFCDLCSANIKKELQDIDDVNNVRLYPKQSLIIFNFTKAYKLFTALNILSEIGYYEIGERINRPKMPEVCNCQIEILVKFFVNLREERMSKGVLFLYEI